MTTRIKLEALSPTETNSYVASRLASAGCDRELFARDALGLAHEASRGILRDIDRICLLGLHLAAHQDRTMVDTEHIIAAAHDEDIEGAAE